MKGNKYNLGRKFTEDQLLAHQASMLKRSERQRDHEQFGTEKTPNGKFRARVFIDNKITNIGTFETRKEAHDIAVMALTLSEEELAEAIKNIKLTSEFKRAAADESWGTHRHDSWTRFAARVGNQHLGMFDTQGDAHDAAVAFKFNGVLPNLPNAHDNPSWGTTRKPNGRFQTKLHINGKMRCYGTYDTPKEAHDLAIKIKYANWPAHINQESEPQAA